MYGLTVRGTLARVCRFQEPGFIFHMPNDFGPTIEGKATYFSFTLIGNDVYVGWLRPYN
jgi:hypothetical protein